MFLKEVNRDEQPDLFQRWARAENCRRSRGGLVRSGTGKIAHVHSVTVFEGGRAVTEKEAVDTAKSLAKRAGRPIAELAVKVSKDLSHAHRPHHIDAKSGEFVPAATPKRAKAPKARS